VSKCFGKGIIPLSGCVMSSLLAMCPETKCFMGQVVPRRLDNSGFFAFVCVCVCVSFLCFVSAGGSSKLGVRDTLLS